MSQVMLKSPRVEAIRPLVVSALEAKKNEILTGIMKTKQKLSIFEKTFSLSTSDFIIKGSSRDVSNFRDGRDRVVWGT